MGTEERVYVFSK